MESETKTVFIPADTLKNVLSRTDPDRPNLNGVYVSIPSSTLDDPILYATDGKTMAKRELSHQPTAPEFEKILLHSSAKTSFRISLPKKKTKNHLKKLMALDQIAEVRVVDGPRPALKFIDLSGDEVRSEVQLSISDLALPDSADQKPFGVNVGLFCRALLAFATAAAASSCPDVSVSVSLGEPLDLIILQDPTGRTEVIMPARLPTP